MQYKHVVPPVHIRFDCRFDVEKNWEQVCAAVVEAEGRGFIVTPTTVLNPITGFIEGWYLHGWERPPAVTIYDACHPAYGQ